MNLNFSLNNLERYSEILLGQPNLVSHSDRHFAEEKLLEFSKSDISYEECKYIIESSKNNFVCFQALRLLKSKLMREWEYLLIDDLKYHYSYCLQFTNKKLASFVMEECYQCLAMICKRNMADDRFNLNLTFNLLNFVEQNFIKQLDSDGFSILRSLLFEFSNTIKSNAILLHINSHKTCKSTFEKEALKKIFILLLNVLSEVNNSNINNVQYINGLLITLNSILNWSFSSSKRFYTNALFIAFNPPVSWNQLIFDSCFIELLFSVHKKIRLQSVMASQSLNCLTQLSTMTGSILLNVAVRIAYFSQFMQAYIQVFSTMEVLDYELNSMMDIIKNLLNQDLQCILKLPEEILKSFFTFFENSTLKICSKILQRNGDDNNIYRDAFETAIECWHMISMSYDQLSGIYNGNFRIAFDSTIFQLVPLYVQSNLNQSDDFQSLNTLKYEEDSDIYDANEDFESDNDNDINVMLMMAKFSRLFSSHFLPLLYGVLSEKIYFYCEILNLFKSQQLNNSNLPLQDKFQNINSDICWLLSFIVEILTNDSTQEVATIPHEVMLYSILNNGQNNLSNIRDIIQNNQIPCADAVIMIISVVIKLEDITEVAVIKDQMFNILSPQLQTSIVSFLCRVLETYCYIDETEYNEISLNILTNFGEDSATSEWFLNRIFDVVEFSLTYWNSDKSSINKTINLLSLIVGNKKRCETILKSNRLHKLINKFCTNEPPFVDLSPWAKNKLCRCIVLAMNNQPIYLQKILEFLYKRFNDITKNIYPFSENLLVDVLDCLIGVASAIRRPNSQFIFSYFKIIMADAIELINTYHNYEEIIRSLLYLYEEISKNMPLYLCKNDIFEIQRLTIILMQNYQKFNIGRLTNSSEIEEEKFSDLLIIMTIILNLLSTDYVDFSSDSLDNESSLNPEFVVHSLDILVPLLTPELLKFPSLCSKYVNLISYLGEMHITSLVALPEKLYYHIMSSIEFSLQNHANLLGRACLEFVTFLAEYIIKNISLSEFVILLSEQFLKVIFHQIFFEFIEESLWNLTCSTLLALLAAHKALFMQLADSLINSVSLKYKAKVSNIFSELIKTEYISINLTNHLDSNLKPKKIDRLKYLENFESLLYEIHTITRIH